MAAKFHGRTGTLVSLSNGNRTAQRNCPTQEFNNGVVLSSDALRDNQIFEVHIDKKVNSWSGSIEIGVTTCDPNNLNFPTSATGFREGTWVMSGSSILKDGHAMIEEYGRDLDQLDEGDRIGVMRNSAGVLHFFVNGVDQGPAATGLPPTVYAVVDMYGKCAQVTIVDQDSNRDMAAQAVISNGVAAEFLTELSNQLSSDLTNQLSNELSNELIAAVEQQILYSNESLVFHEKCGSLIKLSNSRRTAERRRPLDEFNNGVVMTNRPLRNDELFEIRLDRLVDKWSGSIEMGITTHNPSVLDFPATMTNMRSGITNGTIMMSGCGILTNGKGSRREYGEYNLDELTENDRIGLVRKSNGSLHYYINGIDQGVAATNTPSPIWGVVDLYGMAVKVTIIERSDPEYQEVEGARSEVRANRSFWQFSEMFEDNALDVTEDDVSRLTFHPRCGSHVSVINGHRTAHRPNAFDDFNNGVVLTSRVLRPTELFEVRIDRMVNKWAGSIEIGVTTHLPTDLKFPCTMTNIFSGTWMMTGNGIMHNGTTVLEDYGQNLDSLEVGDRVAVMRKGDGTLHFYVNSIDQGPAASNVPANVYGVIDLYGQAAQATICDMSDTLSSPELDSSLLLDSDIRFHNLHGQNAAIVNGGKTAARPNARGEFNDAIVMTTRPLRDNELFEVTVDKMVDRWSGSIEAGVTLIKPEELEFPNTMTDIDYDTWMLSGSAIMQDGATVQTGYTLDLDTLVVGDRIGMMRCSDATLHYYYNGQDMGVACSDISSGVYAVIDLYGQCAQVTITSGLCVVPSENLPCSLEPEQSFNSPICTEASHRFSLCCGKNVTLKNNNSTACRVRNFNHGIVFSAEPLKQEELFEVRIDQLSPAWSGSLVVGLTTMAISDTTPLSLIPATAHDLNTKVTWIVSGSEVMKNGVVIKENYAPSLERLQVGSKVGLKRCSDGTMHVYVNGEDVGTAASNIPKNVFAVVDLYGRVDTVTVTSNVVTEAAPLSSRLTFEEYMRDKVDFHLQPDLDQDQDTAEDITVEFNNNHGKNIRLSQRNLRACRAASYNQGLVVSRKPLPRTELFQVRIEQLNLRWSSSLMLGVLGFNPEKFPLPASAMAIRKSCVVIQGDAVFNCGAKIRERYGPNLDTLQTGHTVGLLIDEDNCLHLHVNGIDHGVATRDIPHPSYVFVDLYGQCEQVTIVANTASCLPPPPITEYREKANLEEGMKEKSVGLGPSRPGPVETRHVRNCEYFNMCQRFKATLGLPDGYFESSLNICYCETCHKLRGDDLYGRRGDPPKEYAVPHGWSRFSVRVSSKAHMLNVSEKWHVSFHGTRAEALRNILDRGDLLIPGDMMMGSSVLSPLPDHFSDRGKPDGCDIKQIFLSPTIKYGGSNTFAPKCKFVDPKTKKMYHCRVAFQVWVKPGSYKIGPQSIGANEQIDPRFSNNELEWATKERGSIMLCGLLIKVE
ncbi:neuralized-like protein 4 [Liolophura sinensis]|uniref:neuralized-like protein 4 n=1 Tax=Liolophura sinensis TaxID=3198878 RepID=UPI00315848E3